MFIEGHIASQKESNIQGKGKLYQKREFIDSSDKSDICNSSDRDSSEGNGISEKSGSKKCKATS